MNIVYESLYEFEKSRVRDKSASVINRLRKGSEYEEIINWLNKYMFRKQYKINNDLTIDIIKGDFIISDGGSSMKGLPEFIKFNSCIRDFVVEGQITDMFGFPEIVGGSLGVSGNKLTDLKGCPKEVHGDLHIMYNPVRFTVNEINAVCKVGGKIYV
jgi:hypothetical protein